MYTGLFLGIVMVFHVVRSVPAVKDTFVYIFTSLFFSSVGVNNVPIGNPPNVPYPTIFIGCCLIIYVYPTSYLLCLWHSASRNRQQSWWSRYNSGGWNAWKWFRLIEILLCDELCGWICAWLWVGRDMVRIDRLDRHRSGACILMNRAWCSPCKSNGVRLGVTLGLWCWQHWENKSSM